MFYCQGGIDDGETDEEQWMDFGEDDLADKSQTLADSLSKAVDNSISTNGQTVLQEILTTYSDVLRLRLGKGKPA